MGNAVDNDQILLQPYELTTLMPLLADLHLKGRERNLLLLPAITSATSALRGAVARPGPRLLWRLPGRSERDRTGSDGTLKGCPSLATERYGAGDVRDTPIAELWATHPALQFNRNRGVEDLWGFCRSCYYAEACRGGCTWTADSLLGRRGTIPIAITAS